MKFIIGDKVKNPKVHGDRLLVVIGFSKMKSGFQRREHETHWVDVAYVERPTVEVDGYHYFDLELASRSEILADELFNI